MTGGWHRANVSKKFKWFASSFFFFSVLFSLAPGAKNRVFMRTSGLDLKALRSVKGTYGVLI